VASWEPPFRFDFVHARLDLGLLDAVVGLAGRAIFSSDGSFRRADSPRAERVADVLRAHGLTVAGELYRRSDEHQVELAVAWIDRPLRTSSAPGL
jgi:hypothetical protein